MNIVILSRSFFPVIGGLERFAHEIARALVSRGHSVHVVTRSPSADPHRDLGQPYQVIRRGGTIGDISILRRADAVLVNGHSARGIAEARLAGHRPVVTHMGYQSFCPTGLAEGVGCDAGPPPGPCESCPRRGTVARSRVYIHQRSLRQASANVAISEYVRSRIGPSVSAVIYLPVAERFFSWDGRISENRTVLFVGRLVHEKGLDLLLQACRAVEGLSVLIAGDGPMRHSWQQLAVQLDLGRRATFLGDISPDQTVDLYSRASVACVPSRWHEAFGYVAAEAMAAGVPVVGTPVGALTELLGTGRGFLASECSPDGLAVAINEALSSSALERARRAREFALNEFALEEIASRYESLLSLSR